MHVHRIPETGTGIGKKEKDETLIQKLRWNGREFHTINLQPKLQQKGRGGGDFTALLT